MRRVKEGQFPHQPGEDTIPEWILAVHIAGDAAAHGDVRVSGLHRQEQATPGEHAEQSTQRDSGFDMNYPCDLVKVKDAVKARHTEHDGHSRKTGSGQRQSRPLNTNLVAGAQS